MAVRLPKTPVSRQQRRRNTRTALKGLASAGSQLMRYPEAPEGGSIPDADAFKAAGYNLIAATRGYVEIPVDSVPEPERSAVIKLLRASEQEWRYQQVFLRPDGTFALMGATLEDFSTEPPEAILDGENMREFGIPEETYWKAMKWAMTEARKKAVASGESLTLTELREKARSAVLAAAQDSTADLPDGNRQETA